MSGESVLAGARRTRLEQRTGARGEEGGGVHSMDIPAMCLCCVEIIFCLDR